MARQPTRTKIQKALEMVEVDCRVTGSMDTLQERLRQIKPLAKYEPEVMVPLDMLEKVIVSLCKQYKFMLGYLSVDINSNELNVIWRSVIEHAKSETEIVRMAAIYGNSLYEIVAKSALFMYIMREEVGKRGKS